MKEDSVEDRDRVAHASSREEFIEEFMNANAFVAVRYVSRCRETVVIFPPTASCHSPRSGEALVVYELPRRTSRQV